MSIIHDIFITHSWHIQLSQPNWDIISRYSFLEAFVLQKNCFVQLQISFLRAGICVRRLRPTPLYLIMTRGRQWQSPWYPHGYSCWYCQPVSDTDFVKLEGQGRGVVPPPDIADKIERGKRRQWYYFWSHQLLIIDVLPQYPPRLVTLALSVSRLGPLIIALTRSLENNYHNLICLAYWSRWWIFTNLG